MYDVKKLPTNPGILHKIRQRSVKNFTRMNLRIIVTYLPPWFRKWILVDIGVIFRSKETYNLSGVDATSNPPVRQKLWNWFFFGFVSRRASHVGKMLEVTGAKTLPPFFMMTNWKPHPNIREAFNILSVIEAASGIFWRVFVVGKTKGKAIL